MAAPSSRVDVTPAGCGRRIFTLARSQACNRHLGKRLERINGRTVRRALTGSREIAAGVGPAHRNGEVATLKAVWLIDVSTLRGIGRHLGWQPRANTSITIMRPPQRGHGQGSTRGVSTAISGCSCGSARDSVYDAFVARKKAGAHGCQIRMTFTATRCFGSASCLCSSWGPACWAEAPFC
jgi:hypothetical protein